MTVQELVKIVREVREQKHHDLCVGVDLGHPRRRSTGLALCCPHCGKVWYVLAYPIHALVLCVALRDRISVVAIDAPLSLPKTGIERELERVCRKLGYRLMPPLLGPMRKLTVTGICLREVLETCGITVIEIHPTSSLKVMKTTSDYVLRLLGLGKVRLSKHVVDAIVGCVTALAFHLNLYFEVSDPDGNKLILPKPEVLAVWRRRGLL